MHLLLLALGAIAASGGPAAGFVQVGGGVPGATNRAGPAAARSPRVSLAQGAAAASSSSTRRFEFVPYGETYSGGAKSISADGLVKGSDLHLTHWTNNETPQVKPHPRRRTRVPCTA
jgi:hypothetical protein